MEVFSTNLKFYLSSLIIANRLGRGENELFHFRPFKRKLEATDADFIVDDIFICICNTSGGEFTNLAMLHENFAYSS